MYRVIEVKPGQYAVRVRTNNWIWNRWEKLNGRYLYWNARYAHEAGKERQIYYFKMRHLPRVVFDGKRHAIHSRKNCCCEDVRIPMYTNF